MATKKSKSTVLPWFKRAFVFALRSGKYKQARGVLRTKDGCFCASGVACDLADPSGWDSYNGFQYGGSWGYGGIPATLRTEIGMTGVQENKIIALNDGGKSFDYIANYVEKYF